jgi:hypothetical protein
MLQSARLAKMADPGEKIVLNDVGCTIFYTDVSIIDLYGLTSHQVAAMGGKNMLTKADITALTVRPNVKMASVYPAWYPNIMPDSWIAVGQWSMPGRLYYAANPLVRVYATQPLFRAEVLSRWKKFRAGLPSWVNVQDLD